MCVDDSQKGVFGLDFVGLAKLPSQFRACSKVSFNLSCKHLEAHDSSHEHRRTVVPEP